MPTTTSLTTRRFARFCYLWLIDGIEMAFTDDALLEPGDFTGYGHDVRAYLDTSGAQVEEAVDIRSGKLDEVSATFTLIDFDGELAELFRAEDPDEEPLEQSVYPADDLAARTELHGLHVGTERIGPAGERAQYPCIPGHQIGSMHIGADQELPHHRPAPVTSTPIVWRGRRCALYRCYIDTDGTRRPFSEAERIWWGTMTDQGQVDGRRWELEVAGPQSWLQRDLGVLTQRDPVYAIGALALSDLAGLDETRIGVSFSLAIAGGNELYGSRDFTASITGDTPADIIADISAELSTAQGTVGPDGAFNAANNRYVSIDGLGRITIHTDADDNNIARMRLTLHAKVWRALGYDPIAQRAADGAEHVAFAYYAAEGPDLPNEGAPNGTAPGSGYLTATIDTKAPADPDNGDNDGHPRVYQPLYTGGVTVLLARIGDGVVQVIDIDNGLGGSSVYARGQWSRPPASDPDSPEDPYPLGGGVNRQGLWLFYGKRRDSSGEYDERWVGRASWPAGALQQRGLVSGGRIVVHEWLPPRRFGFDRPTPAADWAARANAEESYRIRAVPILALDYHAHAYERAHVVIERLLRSSGTAGPWSSYSLDPAAAPQAGDNDSAGNPPRDAEVEDLGLAIPGEMVANVLAFGLEGEALPQGLGEVKVAFSPGQPADDLLEGLMRPFGWAITLRGGAYGIFSPSRTPEPAAVDVVLDGSTKLGTRGGEGSITQELRAFAPIDRFELTYSFAPHFEKFAQAYATDSKDTGRRYRAGGIVERQRGHGIRHLEGWSTRARDLGTWWNRRHFFVRNWPYLDREPRRVGEWVRITDPRGADPAGTYGLDEMLGVITRVQTNLKPGDGEPFAALDVLVYAGSAGVPRLHAFAARAIGIDTDNDLLYVSDNWLGIAHPDWPGDASRFLETPFPGLAAMGGEADIVIVQWDGAAWREPITGHFVRGAGTDANGDYLALDSTPAGYYHKMDTLVFLAPRGDQTAPWVLERYGVTCTRAGTFDGATPGYRWEDG